MSELTALCVVYIALSLAWGDFAPRVKQAKRALARRKRIKDRGAK